MRFKLHINSVIESLLLSDLLVFFGLGLITPIFAIFITEQVHGGTLEAVGLATAIYAVVRCLTTIPLSRYMDRTDGERDEFHFMIIGTLCAAIIPLFYIQVTEIWQVYVLEALYGLSQSMAIPGWRIIFTNHIDGGQVGYEWSLEDIMIGLGTAVAAYLGAIIANHYGFTAVFVCMSVVSVMGTLLLLPIRAEMKSKREVMRLRHRRQQISPVGNIEKI
jgi:MFS family permease